jgi:hypothetical protein
LGTSVRKQRGKLVPRIGPREHVGIGRNVEKATAGSVKQANKREAPRVAAAVDVASLTEGSNSSPLLHGNAPTFGQHD